jgi:hypothetical protein
MHSWAGEHCKKVARGWRFGRVLAAMLGLSRREDLVPIAAATWRHGARERSASFKRAEPK